MSRGSEIRPVDTRYYRGEIYLYVSGGDGGTILYNTWKQEPEAHEAWLDLYKIGMRPIPPSAYDKLDDCKVSGKRYCAYLDRTFKPIHMLSASDKSLSERKRIGAWCGIDITKTYKVLMWDYAHMDWMVRKDGAEPIPTTMIIHPTTGIVYNIPTETIDKFNQQKLF